MEKYKVEKQLKVAEERIETLSNQIEKMMCCGNCKFYINDTTKWCLKNGGAFFECNLSEDWELAE